MAKYRPIHVSYWQDGFILTLPPEEKYFYLYLMTNSKTTQCGIFELPLRVIEMETGLSADRIFELIHKFIDYKKIQYNEETREIFLLNWIKHNSIKSPKIIACCAKELETVKHIPFIQEFGRLCVRYGYPIDTLSILSKTGFDMYGEEQEQKREEKQQQEQPEKPVVVVFHNPFKLFESEGFGTLSQTISDDLGELIDDYGERWVVEAMKVAVRRGKRSLSFVNGVLKNWRADGISQPWEEKDKPVPPKMTEEERLRMERERPNERPIVNL